MDKEKVYNTLAFICAIWFACFGMFWTYWMNLFIAYPVGLLGLFFWYKASRIRQSAFNNISLSILIIGLICSLGALLFYI